jgi:hypothetical protein
MTIRIMMITQQFFCLQIKSRFGAKIQHKYEKINGGFQRFRKPLKYIIMKKNQLKHIRLNS